jgi:ribonuclease HII
MPDFSHEYRNGRADGKVICGVDEVGRGPLAGPVVAAAVILPPDFPDTLAAQIRDSKKMSEVARERLYTPLTTVCRFAVAEASVEEIDTLNILWATMLAMQRAIAGLGAVDVALIDGNRTPKLACAAEALVKGDDKSLSIAAASIIAKVHRDRLMKELDAAYPPYGWARNAGYGTPEHLQALADFGATPWHRASFAPVRAVLAVRKSA